jgi:hypothetical protein
LKNDGECSGAVFKTNPSSSSSSFSFALLLIPSKVFSLSLGYSKHTGTQENKKREEEISFWVELMIKRGCASRSDLSTVSDIA